MVETHPEKRLIGYARVSTYGQTLDTQLEQLRGAGCSKIFREKVTGAHNDRRQLLKMLDTIAPGDVVTVTRIDRLARSTFDLFAIVKQIVDAKAQFRSLAEPWADTGTSTGRLMIAVLGGFADGERDLIRTRTAEGRSRAQKRGQHMGRPPKLTPTQQAETRKRRAQGATLAELARSYGVERARFHGLRRYWLSLSVRDQIEAMVSFKSTKAYRNFDHAVRRQLRYVRGVAHDNFLQAVLETGVRRQLSVTPNTYYGGLWRAQLGNRWKNVTKDGKVLRVPCPYARKRMKPIPEKVSDGRANPKGITCLYVATDYETALLEVRPLIGSYVTVAKVKITKDLKIVDFTSSDANFRHRFGVEAIDAKERGVWSDINDAFSKPVERSDSSLDYIPTQILAELFKSNGLDGVAYKSSYGERGYNIALFDLDAGEIEDCYLCQVADVSLKITRIDDSGRKFYL